MASSSPEVSWQLRFRGIALAKEAEAELRAYFKHVPELSLGKISLEGIATEAEAQAVVEKMFHDLKSKGIAIFSETISESIKLAIVRDPDGNQIVFAQGQGENHRAVA